jgi:HEAT repeat protein
MCAPPLGNSSHRYVNLFEPPVAASRASAAKADEITSRIGDQGSLFSDYGRLVVNEAEREAAVLKDLDDISLVDRVMAIAPNIEDGDDDDDEYRPLIHELHRRGTPLIFDQAVALIVSDDPRVRSMACDVLSQLGFETGQPFAAETVPLLARVCAEEMSPFVLGSAITAMGHLPRPEALPYVVPHAQHADPRVRLSVACALPSIADCEWLDQTHPVVTTLMQLTFDGDAHVRDWATFGLGTQVNVDGVAVRQCLLARVDDPHDDTRAEAIAGLTRRHTPGVESYIRDALCADSVGRMAVESAGWLGDPSLAEPLAQLVDWWDVDVELLEDARRRCDPTRSDAELTVMRALLDAAERSGASLIFSSGLLSEPEVTVFADGSEGNGYSMDALLGRAGGSVDAAVQLIRDDLDNAHPSLGLQSSE